jgi:hypothetical protein
MAVTTEDMWTKLYGDSEVGNLCCDYGNFKYMEEMSFPRVQKMMKNLRTHKQ